jgi:adenylate cyclase
MGQEIERRFLVCGDGWRVPECGKRFRQGFLSTAPERVVRVRIVNDRATLTIKGKAQGAMRPEFEYPIPLEDAAYLLESMCERPLIDKTRYTLPIGGLVWEVDEFYAENQGLIIAEVELASTEQSIDPRPAWVGTEITHDGRYSNASLVRLPYCQWPASD